jgi:hypothetical protein
MAKSFNDRGSMLRVPLLQCAAKHAHSSYLFESRLRFATQTGNTRDRFQASFHA